MNDARVIDLATEAHKRGLVLVINEHGEAELVRIVQPGQQRIGVALKEAA